MRIWTWLVVCVNLGACVTGFTLIAPGVVELNGLQVNPDSAWNRAPSRIDRSLRPDAALWTRDGLPLDRLYLIPAIPDGSSAFVSRRDDAALPVFRAGMLPNELEELTESSVAKLFGEGGASVKTSNLRPQRYGVDRGVMFNLDVAVSEGPDYRGLAGAFTAEGALYLMLYFGAEPYYYEKHLAAAEAVISGARRAAKTRPRTVDWPTPAT